MKKLILTILLLLTFTPSLGVVETHAYKIKLLEPIPKFGDSKGGEYIEGNDGLELFLEYVSRVYNYAAVVGGIFCVAVIVFQAINVIMGGANNSFVSEAKDKIMQAIFSLILLLATAMVLRLVNPNFYTFTPPPSQGVVHEVLV